MRERSRPLAFGICVAVALAAPAQGGEQELETGRRPRQPRHSLGRAIANPTARLSLQASPSNLGSRCAHGDRKAPPDLAFTGKSLEFDPFEELREIHLLDPKRKRSLRGAEIEDAVGLNPAAGQVPRSVLQAEPPFGFQPERDQAVPQLDAEIHSGHGDEL